MNTMNKILIVAVVGIAMSFFPLASALSTEQLEFRGQKYDRNSECDFMVINYLSAPPYDLRQVQSLMLFDKGMCDPQNPVDLSENCPYYVITELGFCELK
jgi:hypothetical protein